MGISFLFLRVPLFFYTLNEKYKHIYIHNKSKLLGLEIHQSNAISPSQPNLLVAAKINHYLRHHWFIGCEATAGCQFHLRLGHLNFVFISILSPFDPSWFRLRFISDAHGSNLMMMMVPLLLLLWWWWWWWIVLLLINILMLIIIILLLLTIL